MKDDETVLRGFETAVIDRIHVLGIDRQKVDAALDVTDLSGETVFDIGKNAQIRKADVDEDVKASRLQGLKLNAVGIVVWLQCDGSTTVEEIANELDATFPTERIEPVAETSPYFLTQLTELGLIRYEDVT